LLRLKIGGEKGFTEHKYLENTITSTLEPLSFLPLPLPAVHNHHLARQQYYLITPLNRPQINPTTINFNISISQPDIRNSGHHTTTDK